MIFHLSRFLLQLEGIVYNNIRSSFYPAGRYFDVTTANTLVYYDGRNTYRWPNTHRLDLSAQYKFSPSVIFGKTFDSELTISVYNAYNQKNPFSISPTQARDGDEYGLQKLSLFGIIPTVSWNFIF